MDGSGTFLRRPAKGATRIEGLSSCRDCGFEARGEMLAVEEDGTMVRRCEACAQARYPGLVRDWDAVAPVWLPEMSQAKVSHLARTMAVLPSLLPEGEEPKGVLARAHAGADAIRGFLWRRNLLLCRAVRASSAGLHETLEGAGVDAVGFAEAGMRLVPMRIDPGRIEAWCESGTFFGLTAGCIEETGGYHDA